jgi:hypothetical protein
MAQVPALGLLACSCCWGRWAPRCHHPAASATGQAIQAARAPFEPAGVGTSIAAQVPQLGQGGVPRTTFTESRAAATLTGRSARCREQGGSCWSAGGGAGHTARPAGSTHMLKLPAPLSHSSCIPPARPSRVHRRLVHGLMVSVKVCPQVRQSRCRPPTTTARAACSPGTPRRIDLLLLRRRAGGHAQVPAPLASRPPPRGSSTSRCRPLAGCRGRPAGQVRWRAARLLGRGGGCAGCAAGQGRQAGRRVGRRRPGLLQPGPRRASCCSKRSGGSQLAPGRQGRKRGGVGVGWVPGVFQRGHQLPSLHHHQRGPVWRRQRCANVRSTPLGEHERVSRVSRSRGTRAPNRACTGPAGCGITWAHSATAIAAVNSADRHAAGERAIAISCEAISPCARSLRSPHRVIGAYSACSAC